MAGLEAARARGRKGGRPHKLSDKQKALVLKLHKDGKDSVKDICQMMNISKETLYNYIGKFEVKE